LTAALELARRTGIKPLVLEKSGYMGGIARTVSYNGNRIDIGGHRFFSKSDRVMDWWTSILPVEQTGEAKTRSASWLEIRRRTAPGRIQGLRTW
jgi:protoporphyrinogen oxidase